MNCTARAGAIRTGLAALVVCAIAAPSARAGAIASWSGAGASANVFGGGLGARTIDNAGPTASASEARSQVVTYNGPSYSVGPWTRTVSGSATARASGEAVGLLQAGANYQAPNPGTRPQVIASEGFDVTSSARWTDDRLSLRPGDDGATPAMIRLNFAFDLVARGASGTAGGALGSVTLAAGGQSLVLYPDPLSPPPEGAAFFTDGTSVDASPHAGGWSNYRGMFHVDLPVGPGGITDPFGLGLDVSAYGGLVSNAAMNTSLNASVSLLSLTTTDGRLLSDLGISATFDSGMLAPGMSAQPAPAPEPSSLIVLGALATAFGVHRRRSRTRS